MRMFGVPRVQSNTLAVVKTMVRGNRGALLIAVSLTAFGNFLQASSLVSLAPIIDLFIHPNPATANGITRFISHFLASIGQPTSFLTVTAVFLFIVIFKNVVLYFAQYAVSRLHFRLTQNTILDGFRAMMSARWSFFVSKNYGLLGNTFVRESDKVGLAFEAVAAMVSKVLEISSYLVLAVVISWQLTALVLLLIVLCVLPFALFGKLTRRAGKIHTETANRFQGIILETLNAAKLVLGYGNQKKSVDALEQIVPAHVHAALQFVMVRVLTPLLFEPIGMVITLSAVYFGYYRYHIEVSLLFIMLYAFRMCALRAVEFIDQINVLNHMSPALEQINALRSEAAAMAESTGTHPFRTLKQAIALVRATFVHENGTTVLHDVTLSVLKGTMVAIVGKSGAGKTTLLDIIMGFHELKLGQYAIDGVPFCDIDLLSWRQKIGFVPQDPFLFNRSIRENLLWSNEHATDGELSEACRLANAHGFIMALPHQYDAIVGERGVMLSGGERQRLALARALVRRPELLILDEATSSLDSDSERLIQQSIEQVARLSTIIVVAHRLSTIRAADYIYVLDRGRIIEEGNFTELMAKTGGAFLKAAELQGITNSDALQETGEVLQ